MKEDIPLKVFTILADSDKPLTRKDICAIGSISPQLFDYWITSMISSGIVILLERKKYTIQSIFKDKELPALIEPLIRKISDNLKIQDENKLEEAVSANLSLYMRYLSGEVD